jgi:hypothetical protein
MLVELRASAGEDEGGLIEHFMREQSPLDAAQLFRLRTTLERYREFLTEQFITLPADGARLTPSHGALVALPVRDLFTTNYDSLIELAFEREGRELAVSTTPGEFRPTNTSESAVGGGVIGGWIAQVLRMRPAMLQYPAGLT